jgi:hypothetical protein
MAIDTRALRLTVAEVEEIIASLETAKTISNLSGLQRRQLQDAHDDLVDALSSADRGETHLPIPMMRRILKCTLMTQTWLSEMLTQLYAGSNNED